MARCPECEFIHQAKDKELFFCLKSRDYIKHEIDESVSCDGFKPILEKI